MAMDIVDLESMIDDLQASEQHQSNGMLQNALTVARLALIPMSEDDRDEVCQTMLELIRAKRRHAPIVSFPRHSFGRGKLRAEQLN